jgi:hypothetical protein
MHGVHTECRKADGYILRAFASRCAVPHPFAGFCDDCLSLAHVGGPALVLHMHHAPQHNRNLTKFRTLRRLVPPRRAFHMRNAHVLRLCIDASHIFVNLLVSRHRDTRWRWNQSGQLGPFAGSPVVSITSGWDVVDALRVRRCAAKPPIKAPQNPASCVAKGLILARSTATDTAQKPAKLSAATFIIRELLPLMFRKCPLPYTSFCFRIGSSRIRFPVAAKIALQIAGAIGGTPGSPTPVGGFSSIPIRCTRVSTGASLMRATG